VLVLIGLLQATPVAASSTLNVPGNYATIQAAIDAAVSGDIVVVGPGTYSENINFKGKAITVESAQGSSVTTIDGGHVAPVVTFNTSETSGAVLQGFTIQHGFPPATYQYMGGGIHIQGASPTITGNVITSNTACGHGAGISVQGASPNIHDNTITANSEQTGCSGANGGGIGIIGGASPQIVHNVITNNTASFGGGIALNSAGTPLVFDNTISNNTAPIQGGGIWAVNQSDASILQNLITNNTSSQSGGALYSSVPFGTRGPFVVNNTFVGNSGSDSTIFISGFDSQGEYANNIVDSSNAQPVVYCQTGNIPIFDHNDMFNSIGPIGQGNCAQVVGTNGNISADPGFVSSSDFHLTTASPAVDSGDNASPAVPATDFDGSPRVNGPFVDQGVYELQQPLAITVGSPLVQVEGAAGPALVAHFSGGYGPFIASVAWGDGLATPATISGSTLSASHVYAEEGAFTVTVTITDSTAAMASGTTSASISDAALTVIGMPLTSVEGAGFSGTVARFTDADPNGAVTDYSAVITWGDQSRSPGTVASDGAGGFVVTGNHTYAEEGSYSVGVSATDIGGATASSTASASTGDAALSSSAAAFSAVEGASFNGSVATFADADPNGAVADYTATINWGDQTTSAGTIGPGPNGAFVVNGSHAYAEEGAFTVTVTITDAGGSTTTATTTATVGDAALSATGTTLSEKHHVNFTATVATLTDADPGGLAGDYTGQISWGDGTTTACPSSACSIVRQPSGTFAVSGTHNYAKHGTYTVTIQLRDAGGATTGATTTILVS